MPVITCPNCKNQLSIDLSMNSFGCPHCDAEYLIVEKDGRKVLRKIKAPSTLSAPTPSPFTIETEPPRQVPLRCPTCKQEFLVDMEASDFDCPHCGAEYIVVAQDGRRVVRRKPSSPPASMAKPRNTRAQEQALQRQIADHVQMGYTVTTQTSNSATFYRRSKFSCLFFILFNYLYILWWLIKGEDTVYIIVDEDGKVKKQKALPSIYKPILLLLFYFPVGVAYSVWYAFQWAGDRPNRQWAKITSLVVAGILSLLMIVSMVFSSLDASTSSTKDVGRSMQERSSTQTVTRSPQTETYATNTPEVFLPATITPTSTDFSSTPTPLTVITPIPTTETSNGDGYQAPQQEAMVLEYLFQLDTLVSKLAVQGELASTLTEELEDDPYLFYDEFWKQRLFSLLDDIIDTSDDLANISPVPDELMAVDGYVKKAAEYYKMGFGTLKVAINNMDADKLDLAADYLLEANRYMDLAIIELDKVAPENESDAFVG